MSTNASQNPKDGNQSGTKGKTPLPSARADREGSEPKASLGQAPVWFVIICALLFFVGQVYLDNYAGGFDPKVYGPFASARDLDSAVPKSNDAALIAKGQALFLNNCKSCHQENGLGTADFPPLALSEWVNSPDPSRLIRIPLHGLTGPIKVKDKDWDKTMGVAFGDQLKDDELAGILTYVRQAWGNSAPPVKAEQVKAVRAATAGRNQNWTVPELLAVPLTQ